jgi:oligoribonuclease NrnB/cAMP/cGMP phosphodiesterase (DHH superfamily)
VSQVHTPGLKQPKLFDPHITHHELVRWTGAHVATDGGECAGAAAVAAVEVRGREAAHTHAYD